MSKAGCTVWPCMKCWVIMEAKDEDHCKCSQCGTEVWFFEQEAEAADEVAELMQESFVGHVPSNDLLIAGGAGKMRGAGGGGKSKGRSKKHLMQKPTTEELYRRLSST